MNAAHPFWRLPAPLLLASGSAARRQLLEQAQIPIEVVKAPVDEGAIAATLLETRKTPAEIAIALAHAKAEAASRRFPGRWLLAADQTLDHDGRLLMKPVDRIHAEHQLRALRGQRHSLHSAAVLRHGERVVWAGIAGATLEMRGFSDEFLSTYLDQVGDIVTTTVGGYQLEGLGIQLFDTVEGDHATILGLPLLPVLHALRDAGCLAV